MSTRLKAGFVSVLSCLALILAMFASTGVVSAYSAQATQSQVKASTSVHTAVDQRRYGYRGYRGYRGRHYYRYCDRYYYSRCAGYGITYGYSGYRSYHRGYHRRRR